MSYWLKSFDELDKFAIEETLEKDELEKDELFELLLEFIEFEDDFELEDDFILDEILETIEDELATEFIELITLIKLED